MKCLSNACVCVTFDLVTLPEIDDLFLDLLPY
jgi:hypothetical protein